MSKELRTQARELAAQLLSVKKQQRAKLFGADHSDDSVFASALNDLFRANDNNVTTAQKIAIVELIAADCDTETLKTWIDEIAAANENDDDED
jgi:hypothetical protein